MSGSSIHVNADEVIATVRGSVIELEPRRRMRSSHRRAQVVEVALNVIAKRGVQGTTVARIAEGAGVAPAALYAHFSNKKEILVSALDVLFDRIRAVNQSSTHTDALERLREIGLHHTKLVASETDGFVFPLFEFIAAPPEEGLREELRVRQMERVEELVEIVRDGQRQGTIAPEADPYQTAWLMVAKAWAEDVAELIGVTSEWNKEQRSVQFLNLILDSVAVGDRSTGVRETTGAVTPDTSTTGHARTNDRDGGGA